MTPIVFPVTAALLFAIGLYGVLTRARLIQRLLAVNLMASAIFLFLIVTSTGGPHGPDPVPQAMVLTGIVVALSTMAYALVLIRHLRVLTRAETLESIVDD
ncbi:MAG: NADH-quinone oxidoreductase subunit K [Halofilum sp. (in: g-proteobacteria)]|nr:NADH-quinone oxidoreductase subunit K [Halofilum sp. (in: g-proteobacteria)]